MLEFYCHNPGRSGFLTNAEYHTRILLNFLIDAFVVAQFIAPLTFKTIGAVS